MAKSKKNITKRKKKQKGSGKINKQNKTMALIGQGTHGTIYKINDEFVIKKFKNQQLPNKPCLCPQIKPHCETLCDHIHYEFEIHKLIYEKIKETDIKIKIPKCQNYKIDDSYCQYEMEYIYPPLPSEDILIQIDMHTKDKNEILPNVGHFKGYDNINYTNNIILCYHIFYIMTNKLLWITKN